MGPLDLTHTLVAGRECGACFACCEVSAIVDPGLVKPAYTLCPHHRGGCTVYETRFAICRSFHCLWRRLETLNDAARPDQLGVLFAFQREANPDSPFAHVFICGYPLKDNDDEIFETPKVKAILQSFIDDAALPVWIARGERKRLIWPDRELGDAILDPSGVTDPDLKARADAWRKRYDRWVRLYDMAGGG